MAWFTSVLAGIVRLFTPVPSHLSQIHRELKIMNDKVDAMNAAIADLGTAVHDALDKIQAGADAITRAAADDAAIDSAVKTIKDEVSAIRAVVPVTAPPEAPAEAPPAA